MLGWFLLFSSLRRLGLQPSWSRAVRPGSGFRRSLGSFPRGPSAAVALARSLASLAFSSRFRWPTVAGGRPRRLGSSSSPGREFKPHRFVFSSSGNYSGVRVLALFATMQTQNFLSSLSVSFRAVRSARLSRLCPRVGPPLLQRSSRIPSGTAPRAGISG